MADGSMVKNSRNQCNLCRERIVHPMAFLYVRKSLPIMDKVLRVGWSLWNVPTISNILQIYFFVKKKNILVYTSERLLYDGFLFVHCGTIPVVTIEIGVFQRGRKRLTFSWLGGVVVNWRGSHLAEKLSVKWRTYWIHILWPICFNITTTKISHFI